MPSSPPPFDSLWFRLAAGLVVGLALGSFATMLSYRLPRRLSIILPRSHCPQCKAVLKTRDLVPVFSWVFARGKCRACSAKIGARYPVIELATAPAPEHVDGIGIPASAKPAHAATLQLGLT